MKNTFFSQESINPKTQYHLHVLFIIVLIGIVYYPTLDVPFTFDDYPNIVTNPAVTISTIHELPDIFKTEYSGNRPFAMSTFAINHLVNGLNVFGYHVVNILIHIFATIILYKMFVIFPQKSTGFLDNENKNSALYNRQNLAFWGAVLWAVNPVHTQAVTYIVQRMTSMAALFYFAAMYAFLLFRNNLLQGKLTILLVVTFFVLGMTSKEIVITLPITLLLVDYLFFTKKITRLHLICTALITFFTIGISLYYMQDGLPDFFAVYKQRNFSPFQRVMTEWRVFWHYISLYFFPLPSRLHLSYDYSISTGFLTPWTTMTSLLGIIVILTTSFIYRFRFPNLAFATFFFFIALGVESTFLNLEIAFIHRLYLPTAFLLYSLFVTFDTFCIKKCSIIFIVLVGLLSYWTIIRNDDWKKSASFWETDYQRGAHKERSYNNKAAYLIDAGKFKESIPLLEKALESASGVERRNITYNLAMVLFFVERYEESLDLFTKLSNEFGNFAYTQLFRGQIFLHINKIIEAEKLAKLLVNSDSYEFQGKILRSNILRYKGNTDLSEKTLIDLKRSIHQNQFEKHLKIDLELAQVYLLGNKAKEAYKIYLNIVKKYPHTYFVWVKIYQMLKAGGDDEKAEKIKAFLISKGIAVNEKP